MHYYNENDNFACDWLEQLMNRNVIPLGLIDRRSIRDVQPGDLNGFTQCHFFAGIGVWPYALRLAGWPDDRPCWTGSCPCQPFRASYRTAGVIGFEDDRHLWPAWYPLIEQCRPVAIFGEQVTDAIRYGWLDLVQSDLEKIGYACGSAGLSAAGVGAPHRRERLYWVAQSSSPGLEGYGWNEDNGHRPQWADPEPDRPVAATGEVNFWTGSPSVQCSDGRRPIQPGTFPLAHGATNRVGRLRGYGNALVAPVAETFVRAFMDVAGINSPNT